MSDREHNIIIDSDKRKGDKNTPNPYRKKVKRQRVKKTRMTRAEYTRRYYEKHREKILEKQRKRYGYKARENLTEEEKKRRIKESKRAYSIRQAQIQKEIRNKPEEELTPEEMKILESMRRAQRKYYNTKHKR